MGGGMASQLLSAGFPLIVYNRNRERAQPLVDAGAVLASELLTRIDELEQRLRAGAPTHTQQGVIAWTRTV